MVAKRAAYVVTITLMATFVLSDCGEKTYITNQFPTDSVHIQGTVYAWRCGVRDRFNNPLDPEQARFSVETGESATVTFVRDNGFTTTIETDDASDFSLYLSAGSHKIVVETGYTYPPDTFHNIQFVPGDTTLPLDIVYRVGDPLHVSCVFSYLTIADTLSAQAEWDLIVEINQHTYGAKGPFPVFDIGGIRSPSDLRKLDQSQFTRRVYTRYDLPVYRQYPGYGRLYNVVESALLLQNLIDRDTAGVVPANFSMYPTGVYVCLDSDQ